MKLNFFLLVVICSFITKIFSSKFSASLGSTCKRAKTEKTCSKKFKRTKRTKKSKKTSKFSKVLNQYATDFKDLKGLMTHSFIQNEDAKISSYAAITHSNGKFHLTTQSNHKKGELTAEAHYHKTVEKIGWDKLSVSTYKNVNPYLQAYFAGYLEGRMTSKEIFDFYDNIYVNKKGKKTTNPDGTEKVDKFDKMLNFFEKVDIHVSKNMTHLDSSDYETKKTWSRLILGYAQLWGLYAGYSKQIKLDGQHEKKHLEMKQFLVLQADGEIPELLRYFNFKGSPDEGKLKLGDKDYFERGFSINATSPNEFWAKLMWSSKCSALIKLIKDDKGRPVDLFAGHNTWTDYYEMLRTYKHYKFEFDHNEVIQPNEITFSSYPGALSSTDDYYLTTNNLLVMETTIDVIAVSEFKYVKPAEHYIPNFMRVLAATRFAKSAKEWVDIFSAYNSGTYSSQWMVIDYNIFNKIKKSGKQQEKLLYVIEQVPQEIISFDITDYLFRHGFFSSFNRAFFRESKHDLHMNLIKHVYGERMTYKGAARGKIFKQLESEVKTLKDFKQLLRYNGFKVNNPKFKGEVDPSNDDAGEGISSRYDYSPFSNLSGGVDCKVTNSKLAKSLTAYAIAGPTIDENPNLKPFKWTKEHKEQHHGVPDYFDFPWVKTSPKDLRVEKSEIIDFK